MDFSKFTDDQLVALKNRDYSKLTDEQLNMLKASPAKQNGGSKNLGALSPVDENDPTQSKITAVAAGLSNPVGLSDEMSAAGSTAMNVLTGFTSPSDALDEYRSKRDEMRSEFKKIHDANPKIYTASRIASGLVTPGAPTSLASAAGMGVGLGAVGGLGESDADLTRGEFGDAAIDTAKGAGAGAVGGMAGYGLAKGISSLANGSASNGLKDLANYASARAQGAERGTVKSLGADKVREIGRYGLDQKIVTPFATTEEMIARNNAIKARGGQMMGDVYKAIDDAGAGGVSPLDTAVKIEDKIGDFWRSPINKGETNQLENTLESVLMRGDKDIPLQQAQALKEELSKVANWKNKLNITDKEKMARDAYGVVSDEIEKATQNGAEKIGSPDLLEKLKVGKKLYSGSKGSEALLQNKEARELGNKVIGITDAAIAGPAVAAAPFTHGASLLVGVPAALAKKGVEKFGNQSLAVGADKLSNVLSKTPEAFGKFAPILQDAAQRGAKALSVTDSLLRKDPSYSNLINGMASNGVIPTNETASVSTPPVVPPDQQERMPSSQLKGEALWMKRGADKLGLSDQQISDLQSTAKGRDLLIQASELPQNSKRLQMIKDQLGRGK